MKRNNICMILLLILSQSLLATKFAVLNKTGGDEKKGGRVIEVKPVYTGYTNTFVPLDIPSNNIVRYDSGTHHLRRLIWREMQGPLGSKKVLACYIADLEKDLGFTDRFRSAMVITIYSEGKYSINLGKGEQMQKQAGPGNCAPGEEM